MDTDVPESKPLPVAVQPLVASAVALGLAAVIGWLAVSGRRGLVDHDAPPQATARFTVDINAAEADELSQVPGLGPVMAARVVEHRRLHGTFTTHDGLLEVPGIGPATLAEMRPYLRPIGESAAPNAGPGGAKAEP